MRIGSVESLWRYPVKSMRGEELSEAFVGLSRGPWGCAFSSSSNPKGLSYPTGRVQREMLLYRPRSRHPDKAVRPPNLSVAEGIVSVAEGIAPGLNPVVAAPADMVVDVETPSGDVLAIGDPALMRDRSAPSTWA